jgi:hypothetical protein
MARIDHYLHLEMAGSGRGGVRDQGGLRQQHVRRH